MRMEFTRLLEGLWALDFETPSRREASTQSVSQLFEEGSSMLSLLEIRDAKICCVKVTLRDMEGLVAPHSHFLDTLCAFLRGREIAVDDDCLQFYVGVAEDVVDRSEAIVAEATSKICRAFLENQSFRATASVVVQVPATPSQDVMDRFFIGRESDVLPQLALRVSERPPGAEPDILEFRLPGSRLFAEGATNAAALADSVLKTARPAPAGSDPYVISVVSSPGVATCLAESLLNNRHHPYKAFSVSADAIMYFEGVKDPQALDGADLFPALLRCPSLSQLKLEGFRFSEATVEAVQEAMAASAAGNAPAAVSSLTLEACVFVDPTLGFGDLAAAISRSNTLRHLHLLDSPIGVRDMRMLCDMLTGTERSLTTLSVGGMSQHGGNCLSDDCARHLFQRLPSIKALEKLHFEYVVPGFLFRTVVDGFQNNYSLRSLAGLDFKGDSESSERLSGEIQSYVVANAGGRDVVHAAASDPDNRALREEALDLLHRLSHSDDLDDATALFLCLQLILPAPSRVDLTLAS